MEPVLHLSKGLAKHPELAREIGMLMADYAVIELFLWEIYIALSDGPPDAAFASFFGLRSVSKKAELLTNACANMPPIFRRAVRRIIRRVKGAATRRTEIAHVHIQDTGNRPMRVHLYGQSAKVTPLTEDFIRRTADQFHTLGTDLLVLFGQLAAGRADRQIARSRAATNAINAQLQRPQPPQDTPSPLSKEQRAAAVARLGLTELTDKSYVILRPKPGSQFGSYRLASLIIIRG